MQVQDRTGYMPYLCKRVIYKMEKIHEKRFYLWSLSKRIWHFQNSQPTICTPSVQSHCHTFPCITLGLFFFLLCQDFRRDRVSGDTSKWILVALVSLRNERSRFSTVYCSITMVTPLIKGFKSRPLFFKQNKGPWIRTPIVEIWQCSGLRWTSPRGIEMKMLRGAGWRNGIKNESGRQD